MRDVPEFIRRAYEIYGYTHFVNDAGGSLCELEDPDVIAGLAAHTLILYIHASDSDLAALIRRSEESPKPLYYRESFLDEQLDAYMRSRDLEYVAQIDPDDFVRWVFPRLVDARVPRYEAIVREHGYAVSARDISEARDEMDFLDLVENTLGAATPRRQRG
jgi:hypothetical protein